MLRRTPGISSWLIKHCIFANLICQLKRTRRYWVPVPGYLCHSHSTCWPMVEVPVHWRILGILLWQIQHCIFANPIWQSKQTRRYWVLVSDYETWAHIFVAKPQLLLPYHGCYGTPRTRIPESRMLRHGWGFPGSNAVFAARVLLAHDWRSSTTEIFNPVQNELLGYVWSQLRQAADHYGCVIPVQARLKSDKIATEEHVLAVRSALCIV